MLNARKSEYNSIDFKRDFSDDGIIQSDSVFLFCRLLLYLPKLINATLSRQSTSQQGRLTSCLSWSSLTISKPMSPNSAPDAPTFKENSCCCHRQKSSISFSKYHEKQNVPFNSNAMQKGFTRRKQVYPVIKTRCFKILWRALKIVFSCVHFALCYCTMRSLCQPKNDLLITRILGSLVVRASN